MKKFIALLWVLGAVSITAQARYRIKVPYENENGKLIVNARVNGVAGRFIIDTGAPCCLTAPFAQKAGVTGGTSQQAEDSNGRNVQTNIVVIKSFQLGGINFTELQALRWAPGSLAEQFGVDGILGYNLMRMAGHIKFDTRHYEFTLTDYADSLGAEEKYAIPMVQDRFITYLPVTLGSSAKDTVMFDSGSEEFYEMASKKASRLCSQEGVKLLATGHGILSFGAAGIEKGSEKQRIGMNHFQVGNGAFADAVTNTTDGMDSRIGSSFLRYGDVVIDFRAGKFYYKPFRPDSVVNIYDPAWDVEITAPSDHLEAGLVWNTCKDKGLESGMRIVAVNGKRFDKVDMREAVTTNLIRLTGKKGTITYVGRDGKEHTAEVERR